MNRFLILIVASLALLMCCSTQAMSLESGWTTPEFVEFLEVEGPKPATAAPAPVAAAPAAPTSVIKPAAAPLPTIARDNTNVVLPKPILPASARTAATIGVLAPVIPADPTAADLSPIEQQYDSTVPDVPLGFYETLKLTQAEEQVKPVDAPIPSPMWTPQPLLSNPTNTNTFNTRFPVVGSSQPNFFVGSGVGATKKVVPSAANELCGAYAGADVFQIKGNEGVVYNVVKILPKHSQNPASLSLASSASDNTMRTTTACAFDKMWNAAKKDGITILIGSGFRTLGRQQYFWNCHISKKCNKGRLAAKPGRSNHGRGLALDLNQASAGVYRWLAANGQKYGFVRTVRTERWHWEHRPGAPKAPYTGTR